MRKEEKLLTLLMEFLNSLDFELSINIIKNTEEKIIYDVLIIIYDCMQEFERTFENRLKDHDLDEDIDDIYIEFGTFSQIKLALQILEKINPTGLFVSNKKLRDLYCHVRKSADLLHQSLKMIFVCAN